MPHITYGRSTILFTVSHVDRKTLAIHVYPDGSVSVDAPLNASDKAIEAKMHKRAAWICKQQRLFASYPPIIPARKYVSGEGFRYLGRQYRIKVLRGEKRSAKLHGAYLELTLRAEDSSEVAKTLMDRWLRDKALHLFSKLLQECTATCSRIKITDQPPMKLLRMKKRWGSCTTEGTIILNPELIAAPKDCIEYVILHELCHLREHNHSKHFYALLERVCPNWQTLRLKLNQTVELRLEY